MPRRRRLTTTRFSLFAFQDIITCVMGVMLLLTLILCLQLTTTSLAATHRSPADVVNELQERERRLTQQLQQLQQAAEGHQALLATGALDDSRVLQDTVRDAQYASDRAQDQAAREQADLAETAARLEQLRAEQERRAEEIGEIRDLQEQNQNLVAEVKAFESGQRIIYNAHSGSTKRCWIVECTGPHDIRAAPIGESRQPLTFETVSAAESWMLTVSRNGDSLMLLVKPNAADLFDSLTGTLRARGAVFGFDLLPQNLTALDPITGAVPQ